MPPSSPVLPFELLHHILSFLDPSDTRTLKNASLTNSGWVAPSREFLFRQIILRDEDSFGDLKQYIQTSSLSGQVVNELHLSLTDASQFKQAPWLTQLPVAFRSHLPNLHTIRISSLLGRVEDFTSSPLPFPENLSPLTSVTKLTLQHCFLSFPPPPLIFTKILPNLQELRISDAYIIDPPTPTIPGLPSEFKPPPTNLALRLLSVHTTPTTSTLAPLIVDWVLKTRSINTLRSLSLHLAVVELQGLGRVLRKESLGERLETLELNVTGGRVHDSNVLSLCPNLRSLVLRGPNLAHCSEFLAALLEHLASPFLRELTIFLQFNEEYAHPLEIRFIPVIDALNDLFRGQRVPNLKVLRIIYEGAMELEKAKGKIQTGLLDKLDRAMKKSVRFEVVCNCYGGVCPKKGSVGYGSHSSKGISPKCRCVSLFCQCPKAQQPEEPTASVRLERS